MNENNTNTQQPLTPDEWSELAISRYHNACNLLAAQVNRQLFDDVRDWRWVGDEVGDTCDFDDTDFLTPSDMVLILQEGLTYNEYAEWRDANIENLGTKGYINLRSWLMGCRHSMLADKPRKAE